MNNSPFELFRRNLKPLMVLLTGLALFAFVVLPVLDTYMRREMGAGGDAVVARFDGTDLTRTRVDYFTRNHQSTVRFLAELAKETISRGGVPRTAGFQYDTQSNQVQSIGINQDPSTDGTIRTFMFASQATKAGFDLDDNTLQIWLESFTDGMISNSDIDAMLMRSTQNQMGRPHLYEQLRNHLLANVYLTRGYANLYMGDSPMSGPLMTPEEQWSNFLKLNRTAVATTYAVLVHDYLDKTNKTPSETEVVAVYEDGKERDSNEQSPDPAFHRRYSAKFEYLVGDYQNFLDEEVAKLSEEKIREEYDRRLKGGDFQLPETAAADMLKEAEQASEKADPPPPDDQPKVDSGDADSKKVSDEPAKKSADPKSPADQDASGDTPKTDAKSESSEPNPKAAEADAKTSEPESSEPESSEPESSEPESSEPESTDQSNVIGTSAVRLVALQNAEDSGDAGETPQADAEPQETEKADAPENQSKAEDPKPDEPQAEKEGVDPPATESKDDAVKDDAPKTDAPKTDAPKTDAPKTDAEKADAPKTDAEKADAEKADVEKADAAKVESFEDVRQSIAEDMAGPAARARMDAAVTEVSSKMKLYGNKLAIYQTIGTGTPPVKPDLTELAAKLGLQREVVGPYSEDSIADEPIANSFEVGTQFGRRGPSFSVMMYGFDNGQTQLPKQPLFAPIRTADDPAGKIYVCWKTEETEAYTPTLEEVRGEVVMAIRMTEARKLAREAAEAIAKQASAASDQPLQDFVPEDKRDNVKEGLGPFKWLDSFGFSGVTIGNVPELDSVGVEFMEQVFKSEPGTYGVAANDPGRVIYVVSPTKFEPPLEELRRQFQQPTNRMMAMMAGSDSGAILMDFYESVDEQAGFDSFLESDQ